MIRLIPAIVAAFASCAYASDGAPFGISEGDTSSYGSYEFEEREQSASNTAIGKFFRSGERISLTFRNRPSIDLQNSDGCYSDTCAKHWAIGYWEQKDSFLVGIWHYEDPATVIINPRNDRLELIGIPVHSPDRRRLVAFNDGCRIGEPEVQIGRWFGEKPRLEYESFNDALFPHDFTDDLTISKVRWISSEMLELELAQGCDNQRARRGYLTGRLLVDDSWSWAVHKAGE